MQNCLRDQSSFKRQTSNLIESAVNLLHCFTTRKDIFRKITPVHISVLIPVLDLLIEIIQGPCPENQLLLSRLNIFSACRVILSSNSLKYAHQRIIGTIKSKIACLLLAMLEGRATTDIAESMAEKIEPGVFEIAHFSLLKIRATLEEKDEDDKNDDESSIDGYSESNFSVESIDFQNISLAINNLLSVRLCLCKNFPEYDPKKAVPSKDPVIQKEDQEFMDTLVRVEVFWRDKVLYNYFIIL